MWQSSRLEETVLCAELDRARRDLAGVAKLEAGLERPGLLGGDGPAPRWHRLDLKAQVRARAARSAGTPGPLPGDEFRAGLAAASSAPAAPPARWRWTRAGHSLARPVSEGACQPPLRRGGRALGAHVCCTGRWVLRCSLRGSRLRCRERRSGGRLDG